MKNLAVAFQGIIKANRALGRSICADDIDRAWNCMPLMTLVSEG